MNVQMVNTLVTVRQIVQIPLDLSNVLANLDILAMAQFVQVGQVYL